MSLVRDPFQRLQAAVCGCLSQLAEFAYTPVVLQRPRRVLVDETDPWGNPVTAGTVIDMPTIQQQINSALAGLATKNGKAGSAAIVFVPTVNNKKHEAVKFIEQIENLVLCCVNPRSHRCSTVKYEANFQNRLPHCIVGSAVNCS